MIFKTHFIKNQGGFVIFFLLLMLFVYGIHLPPRTIAIAVLDGTFLGYGSWNAVRMGFFSLHVISMQAFIARGRVSELNDALYGALKSLSSVPAMPSPEVNRTPFGSSSFAAYWRLKQAVGQYRREHRHLLMLAMAINVTWLPQG